MPGKLSKDAMTPMGATLDNHALEPTETLWTIFSFFPLITIYYFTYNKIQIFQSLFWKKKIEIISAYISVLTLYDKSPYGSDCP